MGWEIRSADSRSEGVIVRFIPTPLVGAYVLELEERSDDRGFFARSFCEREMAAHGLVSKFVQNNIAHNKSAGTLRGMHWRDRVFPEAKIVRAISGSIWDVIIDLNPASATYLKSFALELSSKNRLSLYVPPLFAHGFQTLEPESDLLYLMSEFYDPHYDRGLRWNDPTFNLQWPMETVIIHDRDNSYPDFVPLQPTDG